jgi:transcriptional antiterminator NusG
LSEVGPESKLILDPLLPVGGEVACWHAVYVTPRHEKSVARYLTYKSVEFFLALYRSKRKWRDGSRVTVELPLFPGYVFVRIGRMQRSSVLQVPGVLAIVSGVGGQPEVIANEAISALQKGMTAESVEPHELLQAGEKVQVVRGAFAGMSGVVVRNKSSFRVVLTVEQIMRSFAVELDAEDVEKIADGC